MPLGESNNFIWFITDIGIAALLKNTNEDIYLLNPEREAIEINLDLSKEEKEFIEFDNKQIFLFYS